MIIIKKTKISIIIKMIIIIEIITKKKGKIMGKIDIIIYMRIIIMQIINMKII